MGHVSLSTQTSEIVGNISVIDVDTHFTEPPDLWTSRAPAAWRDRVPHVVDVNGTPTWILDGIAMSDARAAGVVKADGTKSMGTQFIEWNFEDSHPAAYKVGPRLQLMDEQGIWAQIVYPNIVAFAGHKFDQVKDHALRNLCVTIYNDAMAEFQAESGGRLLPMATLPWWDLDATVREVERIHALGMKGVNTNTDPHNQGLPDLAERHWDPLWEICSDLNLPVNFHIGASASSVSWFGDAPWPSFGPEAKISIGSAVLYLSNARVLSNLLFSGILERFPTLRFASVESGVGWIPFVLEALDYQMEETGGVDYLSMKPSEYFRRQVYACFWFENNSLSEAIRRVGIDNCMFETDFPHPTCLYPTPRLSS